MLHLALLLAALASSQASTSETPAAGWTYREVKDPITDALRGIGVLEGGSLILKCDKNGPSSVYVELLSKEYLGKSHGSSRPLTMRVNDNPAKTQYVQYGDDHVYFSGKGEAALIAKNITNIKIFVVRFTKYDGNTVDLTLSPFGGEPVVRHVFQTCGQSFD